MLRLAADENSNGDIVRGLLRRQEQLDIVRIQDIGLRSAKDPEVLEWAAAQNRILLTHDQATIPKHAYARITQRKAMPGVFIFEDKVLIGRAIEELILLNECTDQSEWDGRIVYLPL